MKVSSFHIIFFILLCSAMGIRAQVTQDFNKSINQIGDCWQAYNMYIETQNTINRANERKALTGSSPTGNPAYFFHSPFIEFNGTGVIEFRHKLSHNQGTDRVLTLFLLDQDEKVVQTLHTHVYRQGGTSPNGNATNVHSVTVPITWTGVYVLRWEWMGVGGSNGVGMIDDIYIDGTDVSDGSNDNGYGYCRPDDEIHLQVCPGTQDWPLQVPHSIPNSDWTWEFFPDPGVGQLDSTIVPGPKDSLVHINWNYEPGDYVVEATEIRPPYNTTTYSVTFFIEVLDPPTVEIEVDSICPGDSTQVEFDFTGTGPWTIEFTDGQNNWQQSFGTNPVVFNLPAYSSAANITVTSLTDGNGCPADPANLPQQAVPFYPVPGSGPIYH